MPSGNAEKLRRLAVSRQGTLSKANFGTAPARAFWRNAA
jgi:hypothetical protein